MPEHQEQPEMQKFVRMGPDGPETHVFAPWQPGQPQRTLRMMMIEVDEDAELRHLSYDDPPHGLTEEEYRDKLAQAVAMAGDLELFTQGLLFTLGRDLIMSHGCDPERAFSAIADFAAKVYDEFST